MIISNSLASQLSYSFVGDSTKQDFTINGTNYLTTQFGWHRRGAEDAEKLLVEHESGPALRLSPHSRSGAKNGSGDSAWADRNVCPTLIRIHAEITNLIAP